MRKLISLVGAGVLALTVASSAFAASPVVGPSKASDSIVGIAVGNGSFTTLVAAVGCADPAVGAALTSGRQLTVFAPTDAAFGKLGLDAGNICEALPQGTLTQILLYHVESGRHFSNSVLPKFAGQTKTVATLLGQALKVDSAGTITTASGGHAAIVLANIPATNGVVHVVDSVLIPSL